MTKTARKPARDAEPGGDAGGPTVQPAQQVLAAHASNTATVTAASTQSRITVTATHARRNVPLPRSTGIHAHAERQIRSVASAVVRARIGAPTITHTLMSGLPR